MPHHCSVVFQFTLLVESQRFKNTAQTSFRFREISFQTEAVCFRKKLVLQRVIVRNETTGTSNPEIFHWDLQVHLSYYVTTFTQNNRNILFYSSFGSLDIQHVTSSIIRWGLQTFQFDPKQSYSFENIGYRLNQKAAPYSDEYRWPGSNSQLKCGIVWVEWMFCGLLDKIVEVKAGCHHNQ